MEKEKKIIAQAGIFILAGFISGQVLASTILCSEDTNKNHMKISDTEVSSCVASGIGNINGNSTNDDFLTSSSGTDFSFVDKSDGDKTYNLQYDQNGSWSFDNSYWLTHGDGSIGFKFGTGNKPDEWFIYELEQGVSSGSWEFINTFGKGGGLSHTNLYTRGTSIPEPGSIALLCLGIFGLAASRRISR